MEAFRGEYYTMASKREYTVEDIERLPEGVRAELFDGEMIFMSTPTTTHQEIIGWLYLEIALYIKSNKGKCKVLLSPFAVYIKKDDKNYYEPDLVVICDKEKLDNKGCHGAPDWVIEVVSPSSRKLDHERKRAVYREVGVREYWIVDPEKQIISVYAFEWSKVPVVYRFGAKINSVIYPEFEIDTTPLEEIYYEDIE